MKQELQKTINVLQLLVDQTKALFDKTNTLLTREQYNFLSGKIKQLQDKINPPGGGGSGTGGINGTGQIAADGRIIIQGATTPITVNGTYYKTDVEIRNDAVYTNGTHAIVKSHDTTRGYSIVDLSGIYFLSGFTYNKGSFAGQIVRFNCMHITQSQMLSTGTWSNENAQGTLTMTIQSGQILTDTVLFARTQYYQEDQNNPGSPLMGYYYRSIAYLTTPDKKDNQRIYLAYINEDNSDDVMQYMTGYTPLKISSQNGIWNLTTDTLYWDQSAGQDRPITQHIAKSTTTSVNPYDVTYVKGDNVYSMRQAIVTLPEQMQ